MSENVTHVTDGDFDSQVLQSDLPVLVDYWAEWCGPCKMLTPTIESIAEDYQNKSDIVKINIDEAPGIATRFGIRSIPSILLFKSGKVIEQRVGAVSKEELTSLLDKLIKG